MDPPLLAVSSGIILLWAPVLDGAPQGQTRVQCPFAPDLDHQCVRDPGHHRLGQPRVSPGLTASCYLDDQHCLICTKPGLAGLCFSTNSACGIGTSAVLLQSALLSRG